MKVSILGGGSEIGASCLHLQIGGTSLIVDAGMRVHGDDLLPAVGMLDGLTKPAAILVTHAHADHIGALPVMHRIYPDVPIFTTPPTADLMQIMMHDSFKIMTQRCMETHTLIPYTKEQMAAALGAVRLFPASGVLRLGDLTVTLHRAGHILGAVMFMIDGGREKVLVSGDLSFKAGRTIPGADVPADARPDLLVVESTYGNREHSDRYTEEKRLADNVAEVIAGGGFALIPAFALGRAQDVLLILQDYMDRGLIPEFPIFVDGLVTPISKIYRRYPQYLKGPVAHRIRVSGDAFLTEGRCTAVQPPTRDAVLAGKPACIVASSGMLIGGASVWYAERLIGDAKNAIFITGYQDEESPGRKLLDLAEGESRELELDGTVHAVNCRVDKYGLSAHADADELVRFVEMVRPAATLIVHGDDDARAALHARIDRRRRPMLSENGETYTVIPQAHRRAPRAGARPEQRFVGRLLLYRQTGGADLKPALCTGFHIKTHALICQTSKGKSLRLPTEDIAVVIGPWNRSFDEWTAAAAAVLTYSRPFLQAIAWEGLPEGNYDFEQLAGRLLPSDGLKHRIALALALESLPDDCKRRLAPGRTLYILNNKTLVRLNRLELPIQAKKMNATKAMARIRDLLANNPHFIRCGGDAFGSAAEHMTLYFDFPAVIDEDTRKKWRKQIMAETGWTVDFSDAVRIDRLQGLINERFGTSGAPSVYLETRTVGLAIPRPADAEERIAQIKAETGFSLLFKDEEKKAPAGQTVSDDDGFYRAKTPSPRLENNEAIREAGRWAKDRGITLYKASIKQAAGRPYLEVHFITPEIAHRHEADLEELSYRTGLPVTYAKHPKQNEVIRLAAATIPGAWGMKKNPSLHTSNAQLTVKLPARPPEPELRRIGAAIERLTGYRLTVEVR